VPLTNSFPAATGSNITVFVHSNIVQNCGGVDGGSFAAMVGAGGGYDSAAVGTAESPVPMAMPANGSGDAVPLSLYPPGFDLSGFIIFDPSTAEWVSGSGYSISPAPLTGAQFDDPQPLGGGSGGSGGTNAAPQTGFYEVVKVGATLYGLTNAMIIGGVVQLPFEAGEPSGLLTTVTLEDSGVPIATSINVAPFELPGLLLPLDTTLMSNGVHNISLHAQWTDPGDGTEDGSAAFYEGYSPAVSVTVSNEISFPNWIPGFGELGNSLVVSAQSAHTNAQWYLDVYDSQFSYIGTLGGTTPDGNIYVVWNLVGPDGTLHTDNTFEFVLTTVYGDPVTNSMVVPPTYRVTDPWNAPGDWVVVNQQAWNNFTGSGLLDTMTDGFAGGAQALGLAVRPTAAAGTAYRLHFGQGDPNATSDWAAFRSALYNNLSRNLFYLGHGTPKGLGYAQSNTNLSILAKEIGTVLATIPAGLTNAHKYRFVCLDGCSTASGTLPESFGVIHKENVPGSYYADASLRPSAFAGWNDDKAAGFANTIIVDHPNYFQHFQYQWTIGDGVKAAFNHAAGYPDVQFLSTGQLKVFGNWDLGVNAFNR